MTCRRCRKNLSPEARRCPHCGEPNPEGWELYQTSTVLIASGKTHAVYRSVEEVPLRLRSQLLKSTNSNTSATILIADRRGRMEIARAMRHLPGPSRRRLTKAIFGATTALSKPPRWFSSRSRRAAVGTLILGAISLVAFLLTHHG
jgi:hypothetical protein